MSAFSDELSVEFDTLCGKQRDQMKSYRQGLGLGDEDARNRLYHNIESLEAELEDVYKQLEIEVRGKAAAKESFRVKKDTYSSLRQEFLNIKQDHQRSLLIANGGVAEKAAYRDAQKEKLEASRRK